MLWLVLRNNRYFDEHFDGIVYATCIGMGFAGLENVMYLFQSEGEWIYTGVVRALFSIPGHFFFAILMGYFYSRAHFSKETLQKGKYALLALLAPVVAHGIYDSILMVQNVLPEIAGIFTIALLYFLNKLRKRTSEYMTHLLSKDNSSGGEA